MQPNTTKELEFSTPLTPRSRITLANKELQNQQRYIARTTVLIPFLGSVLAIGLLPLLGIGLIELSLLVSMYILTGLGITVGFHRYFAHRAFKSNKVIEITLAILGSMAAQGPVIFWVATHRCHHQYSDQPNDPHSPRLHGNGIYNQLCGLYYAHIGWLFESLIVNPLIFAKDLVHNPTIVKINQLYLIWIILGLAIPTAIEGILTGSSIGAFQGFMWGGIVRIFLSHHTTWCINSITHVFGRYRFENADQSGNIIWLAILTLGEGWHNNHHAFPNSAKFGMKWWQFDLGYWVIRSLEVTGMAWDVKSPTPGMIQAKQITSV
ncbi:MAG: acyl-CoA desaturase [Nostoc sp.]